MLDFAKNVPSETGGISFRAEFQPPVEPVPVLALSMTTIIDQCNWKKGAQNGGRSKWAPMFLVIDSRSSGTKTIPIFAAAWHIVEKREERSMGY